MGSPDTSRVSFDCEGDTGVSVAPGKSPGIDPDCRTAEVADSVGDITRRTVFYSTRAHCDGVPISHPRHGFPRQ